MPIMNIKHLSLIIALFFAFAESCVSQATSRTRAIERLNRLTERQSEVPPAMGCFQLFLEGGANNPMYCKEFDKIAPICPEDWYDGYCDNLWESGKYPPPIRKRSEGPYTTYCWPGGERMCI